jgi:hypothetical protein
MDVKDGAPMPPGFEPTVAGSDWTGVEIDVAVGAYLDLLGEELAGRQPVKADVVRRLTASLPARSRGAIEYKFENVSAVLDEAGLPWVEGYKPARNYQQVLRRAVLEAMGGGLIENRSPIAEAQQRVTEPSAKLRTGGVRVGPPTAGAGQRRTSSRAVTTGVGGALQDAANKRLGSAGERWVVELERAELTWSGRADLAKRVEWVARTTGDGLGYDVRSFDVDGAEVAIEVKTTNLGPTTPFYLTRRELETSRELGTAFRLYRVFAFSTDPHLYELIGDLEDRAELTPVQWLARVR